jgi:hypothetical protein
MKLTPRTVEVAQKLSKPELLRSGVYLAEFRLVVERPSRKGRDMIDAELAVFDGEGGERIFHDYFSDAVLGSLKIRAACEALGPAVWAKYQAGEVGAADFTGRVRVQIGTEKKRGWPERNVIESYSAATDAGVVPLRQAAG